MLATTHAIGAQRAAYTALALVAGGAPVYLLTLIAWLAGDPLLGWAWSCPGASVLAFPLLTTWLVRHTLVRRPVPFRVTRTEVVIDGERLDRSAIRDVAIVDDALRIDAGARVLHLRIHGREAFAIAEWLVELLSAAPTPDATVDAIPRQLARMRGGHLLR